MSEPSDEPKPCHVCGQVHPLHPVTIRERIFRLCADCATKVVSDIQRTLIPEMR